MSSPHEPKTKSTPVKRLDPPLSPKAFGQATAPAAAKAKEPAGLGKPGGQAATAARVVGPDPKAHNPTGFAAQVPADKRAALERSPVYQFQLKLEKQGYSQEQIDQFRDTIKKNPASVDKAVDTPAGRKILNDFANFDSQTWRHYLPAEPETDRVLHNALGRPDGAYLSQYDLNRLTKMIGADSDTLKQRGLSQHDIDSTYAYLQQTGRTAITPNHDAVAGSAGTFGSKIDYELANRDRKTVALTNSPIIYSVVTGLHGDDETAIALSQAASLVNDMLGAGLAHAQTIRGGMAEAARDRGRVEYTEVAAEARGHTAAEPNRTTVNESARPTTERTDTERVSAARRATEAPAEPLTPKAAESRDPRSVVSTSPERIAAANAALDAAFATADEAVRYATRPGAPTVDAKSLGTIGTTRSTETFRGLTEHIIASTPDHPMAKLLDGNGKLLNSTGKGIDSVQWADNPHYLESGHGFSARAMGPNDPAGLRLQTAAENRDLGTTVEGKQVGGYVNDTTALNIRGVPVSIATARDLVAFGSLDPSIVRAAPIIVFHF